MCYTTVMDQKAFELYLERIRKSSPVTIHQYTANALPAIARLLHTLGHQEIDSLYDIDSMEELQRIEQMLLSSPEFQRLNDDGHRMYSAGLHRYMDFAQGKGFKELDDALSLMDEPCPVRQKEYVHAGYRYNRDRIIVRQVLESEHFLCESNPEHQTFIASSSRKPYMEGHHLIPISMQDEFSNSLDVYANIVSLCPICHRLLHFGQKEDKKKMLVHLFDERKDRLIDSGIHVGDKEFMELTKEASLAGYGHLS